MVDSEKPAAVVAAERLVESMETLTSEMRTLRSYGKRNRILIRLLGASVAFDLLLSIGLGYIGVTAHTASVRATKAAVAARDNADNQRGICVSTNEERGVQVDLWHFVLSSVPASRQTDDFRTYVDQVFAQRQC